jgi:hypothetical protein
MSSRTLPSTYWAFRTVWVACFLVAVLTVSVVAYRYLIGPVLIPWFESVYPGLGGS